MYIYIFSNIYIIYLRITIKITVLSIYFHIPYENVSPGYLSQNILLLQFLIQYQLVIVLCPPIICLVYNHMLTAGLRRFKQAPYTSTKTEGVGVGDLFCSKSVQCLFNPYRQRYFGQKFFINSLLIVASLFCVMHFYEL